MPARLAVLFREGDARAHRGGRPPAPRVFSALRRARSSRCRLTGLTSGALRLLSKNDPDGLESSLAGELVDGYAPGIFIARRRCFFVTSQNSMAPSAVPKTMEVPSGPRTKLLVGRAADRSHRCPVSGFQSCTSLPNPAKIAHPFVEMAKVSTYAGCGGDTAIRCLVFRSQAYTRPS